MNPIDWKEGDIVRRKAPYKRADVAFNELCRVKRILPSLAPSRTLIIVVGNRTTCSPSDRIEKYYDWVSRGEGV